MLKDRKTSDSTALENSSSPWLPLVQKPQGSSFFFFILLKKTFFLFVLFFPFSFLALVQSQRRLSENIYWLRKQGIFPPSIFLFTLCVSLHLSLSCPFSFSLLPFPSFKLTQHGAQIHLDFNSFSSNSVP